MYKYKKEIENLIKMVKKEDNTFFKNQKDIKINENSVNILENKIKKMNKNRK